MNQRKYLAATSARLQSAAASLARLQQRVAAGPGGLGPQEMEVLLRQGRAVRQEFWRLSVETSSGNPGMRVYSAARWEGHRKGLESRALTLQQYLQGAAVPTGCSSTYRGCVQAKSAGNQCLGPVGALCCAWCTAASTKLLHFFLKI